MNDFEIERIFEEIDHALEQDNRFKNSPHATYNQAMKKKNSASPLILPPPMIKSFEEKTPAVIISEEEEHDDLNSVYDKEPFEDESSHEIESDGNFNEITKRLSINDDPMYAGSSVDEDESWDEKANIDGEEHIQSEWLIESKDEMDDSESSEESFPLMEIHTGTQCSLTLGTKVKLPVHVANVELEVDIYDTFNLSRPISSVTKVDLSLHSIEVEVLLPSANLFSKGILLLDIEYVSNCESGTMHSLKIQVPWRKILPVNWIHCPELSSNRSKEYMFISPNGEDLGFQREFSERFGEKIDFHLSSLNCVWNEKFISNERVLIQGTANMQIDLFQKQCMVIERVIMQ